MDGWSRSNGRAPEQGCGTFPKGGAQSPGALGEAGFVEVGVIHRSRSLLVVGGHKRLLRHLRTNLQLVLNTIASGCAFVAGSVALPGTKISDQGGGSSAISFSSLSDLTENALKLK